MSKKSVGVVVHLNASVDESLNESFFLQSTDRNFFESLEH
jgi:hypothetical protein